MSKLVDGDYYWVKSDKYSNWEIAKFEREVKAFRGNDVFWFTDSKYLYKEDCFEIDDKSIGR